MLEILFYLACGAIAGVIGLCALAKMMYDGFKDLEPYDWSDDDDLDGIG